MRKRYVVDCVAPVLTVGSLVCPACRYLVLDSDGGIKPELVSTEQDSDGTFENWIVRCPHCGRQTLAMDTAADAVAEFLNINSTNITKEAVTP